MKSRFRLARMSKFIISLPLFFCLPAFAQYGGGSMGGGTSTGGTYVPPKGSYKSSTGIAIGAGAAAAVGIAYLLLRKSSMAGCVTQSGDEIKLTSDKNKVTYAMEGNTQDLMAGHRAKVTGKKVHSDGQPAFRVKNVKDLGSCLEPQAQAMPQAQP